MLPVVLLETKIFWDGHCDFEYFQTLIRLILP